jgi:hypothetical protein
MRPGEACLPLSEAEGAQGPPAIQALGLVSGTSCYPGPRASLRDLLLSRP